MHWLRVNPLHTEVTGSLDVPPSKYHLHRALILAALSHGHSVISGSSTALHVRHTLRALRDLGIPIDNVSEGYHVKGQAFSPPRGYVRVGSSGSTAQFLLALCSLSPHPLTMIGSPNLSRRPLKPLLQAFSRYGIAWQSRGYSLPVTILPGAPKGGDITIPGLLSQWASSLLLVSPFASRPTSLRISPPVAEEPYVQLTWRMMTLFGLKGSVDWERHEFIIAPQSLKARDYQAPPDFSSLAFPLAFLALHGGSLQIHSYRDSQDHPEGTIIKLLEDIGLKLHRHDATDTLWAESDGHIRPFSVSVRDTPDLLPVLAVLAAAASGRSVITDIESNRHKESNRVLAMLQLRKMGAHIEEIGNTLVIHGGKRLHRTELSSFNDHRVLMALALAASHADAPSRISHGYAYRISYPQFLDVMQSLGLQANVVDEDFTDTFRDSIGEDLQSTRRQNVDDCAGTP
ncbi:3-phosphoshikimate 1-carboxyvinyltransferase [Sulfobacillus thermosulfidooxidans]|uniref:3-phosphoshikimate 1-carboxyvinyltransferase n=1 Tax=Sulfobacillus thermosulfidooxidans TaxID=28034 RepID=UPI0006B4BFC4|nr:hypothetical protein [Sulfobacillus thermosulfidooxidans]